MNKIRVCFFFRSIKPTFGKWYKNGANSKSTVKITPQETNPAICVLPPILSCNVLRDSAADAGYAKKNDENMLAVPKAINSWLAFTSYLCFLANIFANDSETAKHTIPIIRQSINISGMKSKRGIVGSGRLLKNWKLLGSISKSMTDILI